MPPFPGFIGGTYTGRALAADGERCINFYPERIESQAGATKAEYVLLSKPGLALFSALPAASSIDALLEANGRAFACASGQFFEIFSDGTFVLRGQISQGRAQLVASQTQVLILAAGNGFVFTFASNTLAAITAAGWIPGATKIAFIDGYFLALEAVSQEFIISGLNDGLSWAALDFGDAEGEGGNIVSMISDHRQLWLFGNTHSEVYYDSGDANFPFSRLEGGFMEQGCGALDALARFDNSLLWLGRNADGAGVVWFANGYNPQRVSNHAIESMIQGFGVIADASAYCYQDGGHVFYVLHFPSANGGLGATLVYDKSTGLWHERGWWNAKLGVYQADLARTHMFAFGQHIVGDYQAGNLYTQSVNVYTDNGTPIRRVRSSPDLASGGRVAFHSEFRLLMQTGMGLDGPQTPSAPTDFTLAASAGSAVLPGIYYDPLSTLTDWSWSYSFGTDPNLASRIGFAPPWYITDLQVYADGYPSNQNKTTGGALTITGTAGAAGPFPVQVVTDVAYVEVPLTPVAIQINTSSTIAAAPTAITQTLKATVTPQLCLTGLVGANIAVTITPKNGFGAAVSFAVAGLPAGATATFTPATLNGSGTTTLQVSNLSAPGTYPLTITATSGTLTHSVAAALTVSLPPNVG